MSRLTPQTLKAVEFEKSDGQIDLATNGDCVTFDVGAWDNFLVRLPISSSAGAWSAGQTVAVKATLDGADFVTFGGMDVITASGAADAVIGPLAVSGFKQIRLVVGSASGSVGDNKLKPVVRAYQDP